MTATSQHTTTTTTQAGTVVRRWTNLGRRLGVTESRNQRDVVLGAISTMVWEGADGHAAEALDDRTVRAVAATAMAGRLDEIRRIAVVGLPSGGRLVGLEDSSGLRRYLLAQPTPGSRGWLTEVIVVMTECFRAPAV
jgi:hypothetical protein